MKPIAGLLAVLLITSAAQAADAPSPRSSFTPGEPWLDTAGKPIQAHAAGILFKDGVYYWYGEEKTFGSENKVGVSVYSSRDLYNWKSEGIAFPVSALPRELQLNGRGVCERPKVIYNAATGKYVMWMHLDNGQYTLSQAGVAIADSPTGPFRFVSGSRPIKHEFDAGRNDRAQQKELGGTYRDMNLFLDDDGKAYVFYSSEGNRTMYVVRLNAEFTAPESPAILGQTWNRILVNQDREAPAPFKYRDTYYLITSGCTGWNPNAARYATAKNILGPWESKTNPCVGPDAGRTFRSQSTFVLPVAGKSGRYIFLADRWNPGNLADSRYVWLPFAIREDGSFSIAWRDRWDLSLFDNADALSGSSPAPR